MTVPTFTANLAIDGSQAVLTMQGHLDFNAHSAIRQALQSLTMAPAPSAITLNMAGIVAMDAAGLGLLLLIRDAAREKKAPLHLQGACGDVSRILDLSGFTALL